jgi:subtilisin family serine protease
MSLGGVGGRVPAYTRAGLAALDAGCLMIAAAGNESRRPTVIAPTDSPANSPTIMSVAAVDVDLNVAFFSNGGKVEITGPGVDVFSSWIMPRRYNTISGTSMATPHVAGVAALFAQSNSGLRGRALWAALTARARPLPQPPSDIGAGLVQAP